MCLLRHAGPKKDDFLCSYAQRITNVRGAVLPAFDALRQTAVHAFDPYSKH